MAHRGARTEEYLAALRAVSTGADGFGGKFYEIPPGRQDPPPVQRPGPADPARRHVTARDGTGRADRRRLGHREQRRPVEDRRVAKIVRETDEQAAGRRPARVAPAAWCGPAKPVARDGERVLLSGSYEQIREDVAWLGSCGVTEVFYDLNWDPLVGDPAADEGGAVLRASEVLEALAPDGRRSSGGFRIGILGAARIAERALIEPARAVPSVTVAAIATRDKARGESSARCSTGCR